MTDRIKFETTHESRGRRSGHVRSAQQALSFVVALMLLGAGTAHGAPDLVAVDVDASAVTTDTQTLAVSGNLQVSIQNIGDADVVAPFDVLAFEDLNGNGEFDGADQVLGTTLHAAGLLAATSTDVSVVVSGTVQFAGNLIYALADSGNLIAEDDETNNLRNTGQGSIFIPPVGAFNPVVKFQALRGLSIISTPMVVNLTDDNGDGQIDEDDIPDMVFATLPVGQFSGGPIVAISGDDGSQLFQAECPPRFGAQTNCIATLSELGVGDIDGDGLVEIIGANVNGNALIAYENDGTFKWESTVDTLPGRSDSGGAISIVNLDSAGSPEIVVGSSVYDADGILLGDGRDLGGTTAFNLYTAVSGVSDVDLDGTPEIIAGPTAYRLQAGTLVKVWQRTDRFDGFVGIANFDADDFAEIVVVGNGSVYMLEHDGGIAAVWNPGNGGAPVSLPGGGVGGAPTIADYDGDGENEIGIAGASRYVVFEADGSVKWTSPTQDFSSQTTGSTPFDFDGDDRVEIVYRDERFLRIYRGTDGFILYELPMRSGTATELPVVADIDNDGRAEIAVSSDRLFGGTLDDTGIYVIEDANDTWVNTRSIWNQHSYHITNVNLDGTIPAVEQNNWQVPGLNNFRQNLPLPDEGTALDAPDLVPSFIRFDQQNCPEFVTLTARVGNGGSLLAPTGLNVSFYDGPPGAGGTLIGTTQTSFNLEPGQFEDVSVQWNAPPIGNAEVYVVADDDGAGNGAINEGNENNNTASASEVLCSPVCIDNFAARPKPGKIQLTWTHVQGATYDVLRSAASGGPFTQIASTDSSYSTYLDEPVDNGVPYYYQLRRMPGNLGENSCLSEVLGAVAPEGRRDRLTTVPDIREQSQAAAEAALAAANLGVGAVTLVASDTVPAGDVVDQDPPPNSVVPEGFAVAFSVSTGVGGPTNTLPIVDAGGDETITEGDTLNRAGSFVDPDADTWTATVDYGDGGGPEGLFLTPAKTFDLTHVYVDDGVFTVTVTVNDGTGPGSASFSVEVLNAAPQVEAGADRTITAGDSTSLDPASFTDAGIADTHTATINWGDGTDEAGVVTQGAGSGTVAGSHAYADPDTYVVTVTVTDNVGGSASDTFTVLVNPVQVAVPDVVGLSQAVAEAAIVAANLTVGTVTTANSSTVPAGDVISQDPAAGTLVDESSPVDLVVSLGPPDTVVPDVVGLSQAAAEAAIVAANLTVGTVSTANSGTVPAGDVISQNPAGGSTATEGSAVDLVVSLGPVQVTVPDVVGLSQAAAEAAIVAADLTVGAVTTANSSTVPAGDVISQDPAAGSVVDESSPVDLVVSLGPVQVAVPFVVGLSQANAEAAIVAANLTVGAVTTANSSTVPAGDVISQDPIAGTLVDESSSVDLVVSLGPVQVTVPNVVGLSQAVAEAAIVSANLTVGAVTAANSDTVPEGDVISQDPVGGSDVDEFSAVNIVVSLGPLLVPVTVPDVVGLSQAAAEASIVAANLTVGTVSTANSDTVPAGDVISQNPPAGASVAENSAVDIVVSLGPVTVTVPDVVGLAQAAAEAAIFGANLTVGAVTTQSSDTVPAGDVISQNPAAGASVAPNSAVDIVVSIGPVVDDVPPSLTATLDRAPPIYDQGDAVQLSITANDNSGTVAVTYALDGGAPQAATLPVTTIDTTTLAIGSTHEIIVTAEDPAANSVSQTLNFVIRDPSDTTAPTVAINTPADLESVTLLTDVIGTADDANLFSYELAISEDGDTFTPVFQGDTAVVNDVLGQLDPTLLENGLYTLRLTAFDVSGNGAFVDQVVMIDGMMKVGHIRYDFLDLRVPVAGVPITIIRTYDNRVKGQRDFGFGWFLSIQTGSFEHNRTPGDGWQILPSSGFFSLPCQVVNETKSHLTEVRISDTEYYTFRLTLSSPAAAIGGCFAVASYQPVGGSSLGASLQILDGTDVLYQNGFNEVLNVDTFLPFDPQRVRLTTPYGIQAVFEGVDHEISQIIDRNGNSLTINDNGVTHSSGVNVQFNRDGQGRITSIVDPNGDALVYEYDANNDLVRFSDADGSFQTYGYDNRHNLTSIQSEGTGPVQMVYDEDGRVIQVIDSEGNVRQLDHDVENRIETSIDALGNATIFEYDPRGNVVSQTDPLGNATTWTFDADDNQTSITDSLGRTLLNTWNTRGKKTSETNPDGGIKAWTYNANNDLLSETDPLGNTTSYAYDASGNLLSRTNALGDTTTYTYDGNGNRLTETDCFGNVWTMTYDGRGNQLSQTDPLGNVTTYTYDNNGNQLTETRTRTTSAGPVVMTWTREYNSRGQVVREVDPEGNATTTEYHPNGHPSLITDARGSSILSEYGAQPGAVVRRVTQDGGESSNVFDAQGRLIAATDENGNTTQQEYDAAGRPFRTIFPDGSATARAFNAAGQPASQTDALGNTQTMEFDGLARVVSTTDALGNVFLTDYDLAGNIVSTTDPQGNVTTFTYDAVNRRIGTTFPDGTSVSKTYTAGCGNFAATETDQAGNTTQFAYDAMNRLVSVTNALGNVTSYTYDEVGNRVTQTDASGRVTRFEYDNLGNMISRILPLGQTESMSYDGTSNLVSHVNFNGDPRTFTYDGRGNVTRKTLPGAVNVDYAYSAVGQVTRAGANDFTYDSGGRLLSDTGPNGALTYTFDPGGNRTSVTTDYGATMYTYDALNRPATVTDADGGVTAYTYDPNGNRAGILYPNGTSTEYSYDSLNRLVQLRNRDNTGADLSVYDYTLGAAGNRLRVVESGPATSGRTVDYVYDALYRLTEERIDEPGTADDRVIEYTYDAVGNRTQRTVAVGSRVVTTTFVYDDNDRLLSESSTASTTSTLVWPDTDAEPYRHASYASMYTGGYVWLSIFGAMAAFGVVVSGRRRQQNPRAPDAWMLFGAPLTLLVFVTLLFDPRLVAAQVSVAAFPGEAAIAAPSGAAVADEAITYAYDDNGNLISRSSGALVDTYQYNPENLLTSAALQLGSNPGNYTYEYNAVGIRTAMVQNGVRTEYLVDSYRPLPQVLAETTGGDTTTYVYGDDLISQNRSGSGRSYYHYDGQLSVRQLTDTTGAVSDTYTYDAFGTLLSITGTTENTYLYSGEQYDPNLGYYYLRARYYNAASGRFISMDPLLGNVFEPVTLHRYLYASANPVMFSDPTGQFSMLEMAVVTAIITVLLAVADGLQIGIAAMVQYFSDIKTSVKWDGLLFSLGLPIGLPPAGVTGMLYVGESECRANRQGNTIKMPIVALAATFGFSIGAGLVNPYAGISPLLSPDWPMESFGWIGPSKSAYFGFASFVGGSLTAIVTLLSVGLIINMGLAAGGASPSTFNANTFGYNAGVRWQYGFSTPLNFLQDGQPCTP